MSTVSIQDPLNPFVTRNHFVNSHLGSSRVCPRWGEYDVIKDGRDCRLYDGLTRFRTNYNGCHEVPIDAPSKFERHMVPKPFLVDMSVHTDTKDMKNNSKMNGKARASSVDVFPQNNPYRKDECGHYMLQDATLDALENCNRKLYCTPRYATMYPRRVTKHCHDPGCDYEKQFSSDTYNEPGPFFTMTSRNNIHNEFNTPEDYSMIPSFNRELNNHATPPGCNHPVPIYNNQNTSTMVDNSFSVLMPTVYKYLVPSTLHYPDNYLMEDYLANKARAEEAEEDNMAADSPRFTRPNIPHDLLQQMQDMKMEMQEALKKQEYFEKQVTDGKPEKSKSLIFKTNTSNPKSETQRRYHIEHPDPVPDLRTFNRHSRRIVFYGFNSSAFRG